MSYNPQAATDFFFDFDNFTNPPWPVQGTSTPTNPPPPSPGTVNAEQVIFGIAQQFYTLGASDFEQLAQQNAGSLSVVINITTTLVQQHFGGFNECLQLGFEDFAQGVLFDERRNTEAYGFWPLHCMDAVYDAEAKEFHAMPYTPNGYYYWYGSIRANSLLPGADQPSWLQFGRCLALAAAIQNAAQPKGIVGPTGFIKPRALPKTPYTNPGNQRIATAELNAFRDRYLNMSFAQLDVAFKTTDAGRLGPQPGGLTGS